MARPGLEQLKRQTYFRILDYYLVVPVIIMSSKSDGSQLITGSITSRNLVLIW